jgi:DNA-binding MarR family transcriptional regulator
MARRIPPVTDARAEDLGDVLQFMRVLWALVHALQRASKRMEQHTGVTGPQRLVLRVVGLFPGVSPGNMARLLHVHPSTLTGVLHRLVTRSLVVRTTAAGDRRRAELALTPAGARLNRLRTGTVETAVTRSLRTLRPSERAAAQVALAALADGLSGPAPARPQAATARRRVAARP